MSDLNTCWTPSKRAQTIDKLKHLTERDALEKYQGMWRVLVRSKRKGWYTSHYSFNTKEDAERAAEAWPLILAGGILNARLTGTQCIFIFHNGETEAEELTNIAIAMPDCGA